MALQLAVSSGSELKIIIIFILFVVLCFIYFIDYL